MSRGSVPHPKSKSARTQNGVIPQAESWGVSSRKGTHSRWCPPETTLIVRPNQAQPHSHLPLENPWGFAPGIRQADPLASQATQWRPLHRRPGIFQSTKACNLLVRKSHSWVCWGVCCLSFEECATSSVESHVLQDHSTR